MIDLPTKIILSDLSHISNADVKFAKISKREKFPFRVSFKFKFPTKVTRNNVDKHEHYLIGKRFILQMDHDPISYLEKIVGTDFKACYMGSLFIAIQF